MLALARRTGYSRFPVFDDDIDDIVGIVHVKQAVAVPRERRAQVPVSALQSEALRVPETMKLDTLLGELRGRGFQMAVVVDEYGGTAGVATLEDLVEELVGEVADEHDRSRADVVRSRNWLTFPGALRPDELLERADVLVPEDGPYETVAGWMMSELGRIAEVGDTVEIEAGVFRVERMDGRRIDRIRFTPTPMPTRRDRGGGRDERLARDRLARRAAARQRASSSARSSRSSPRAARRSSRAPRPGSRAAKTALWAMEHATLMLATCQLGITVCSLLILNVQRAGDPPPARGPARAHRTGPKRSIGTDRVHHHADRRVVPARRARRDGAEEPVVLAARPRCC